MGEIVPLAVTMMVGPQIITSIILVTGKNVIGPSIGYIVGVAVAALFGTLVFSFFAGLFGWSSMGSDEPSSLAVFIQTALIVLLIVASIRTFLKRKTSTLPTWMSNLQSATPRYALRTGLLLISLMPSDIMIMLTVGINRASKNADQIALLPFIGLTTLIAALPLLFYLLFHKKAVAVMPKVRTWMETNSWVVSIVAYVIFIILLWS